MGAALGPAFERDREVRLEAEVGAAADLEEVVEVGDVAGDRDRFPADGLRFATGRVEGEVGFVVRTTKLQPEGFLTSWGTHR